MEEHFSTSDGINNKVVLITGGTGSFGKMFVKHVLAEYSPTKIIVFSNDNVRLRSLFGKDNSRVAYMTGDIRNRSRVLEALCGVDVVVHAAALKQGPLFEQNLEEGTSLFWI